jgi:hypothetical protein
MDSSWPKAERRAQERTRSSMALRAARETIRELLESEDLEIIAREVFEVTARDLKRSR